MNLAGKEIIEVLTDLGFQNQGLRGNHFVLQKGSNTVLIPDEDELAEKTVISLIEQAGLSSKDILKLLKTQRAPSAPSLDDQPEKPQPRGRSPFSRAWSARAWAPPLALFRVLLGTMFLIAALEKAPWLSPPFGWYHDFLLAAELHPSFSFLPDMVRYVLLPNFTALGWIQYFLELFIGILLVAGLFTVLTSFIATVWIAFFWILAAGLPSQWQWSYILWISGLMLLWSMRAGRSFGVDQALARKAEQRKEDSGLWQFISWLV